MLRKERKRNGLGTLSIIMLNPSFGASEMRQWKNAAWTVTPVPQCASYISLCVRVYVCLLDVLLCKHAGKIKLMYRLTHPNLPHLDYQDSVGSQGRKRRTAGKWRPLLHWLCPDNWTCRIEPQALCYRRPALAPLEHGSSCRWNVSQNKLYCQTCLKQPVAFEGRWPLNTGHFVIKLWYHKILML